MDDRLSDVSPPRPIALTELGAARIVSANVDPKAARTGHPHLVKDVEHLARVGVPEDQVGHLLDNVTLVRLVRHHSSGPAA